MQILKVRGPLAGFWVVGLDEHPVRRWSTPEQHWEGPRYRVGPHFTSALGESAMSSRGQPGWGSWVDREVSFEARVRFGASRRI